MKSELTFRPLLTAVVVITLGIVCGAANPAAKTTTPSSSQASYVVSNDDRTRINTTTFYQIIGGMSALSPQLYLANNFETGGVGIGGGFFGTSRLAMVHNNPQCLYVSNAGDGSIAGVVIQSQTLAGTATASPGDDGTANGIGLVVNANYLYAGYTTSGTIATFTVQSGCHLTFLGDTRVIGLQHGKIGGMAITGSMLIVTYGDGSIESFDISGGMPVSNGDKQNSTDYIANASMPNGIDITQDGHYAIFGDAAVDTTVEVSDISSGKLTTTVPYHVATAVSSSSVLLSPDESLLYISNSQGGTITAAFFNKSTGAVTSGCTSNTLNNFYNTWSYVGTLVTQYNSGNGGALFAAEFGAPSSIGIIQVRTSGQSCTLSELPNSPVPNGSSGLLSIESYPPRPF